jgi:hypothetical protein
MAMDLFHSSESAHKSHSRADIHKVMLIGLVSKFVINGKELKVSGHQLIDGAKNEAIKSKWKESSNSKQRRNHNVLSESPSKWTDFQRLVSRASHCFPSRGDTIIFNAITANDFQRKPAPEKKNQKLLFHF